MVEVRADDRNNKDLHYGGETETESPQLGSEFPQQVKILRKQLERHRRIVAGFRQKVETELTEVKHQLAARMSQRKRTEGTVVPTSDFYDELGRRLLISFL